MRPAIVPALLRPPAGMWEIDATAGQILAAFADINRSNGTGVTIPGNAGARLNAAARTSVAAQTNPDATYGYAPHNLLLNSVYAGAATGSPGTAPTNFTFVVSTGTISSITALGDGSNAIALSISAQRHFWRQAVTASAYTTYTCSMLISAVSGLTCADLLLAGSYPAGSTVSGYLADGVTIASNATPSAGTTLSLSVTVAGTAGTIYFWHGVGTSGNATGTCTQARPMVQIGRAYSPYISTTSAAVYGPAIDWLSGIGAYGLRSEEARTNRVTYARDLTGTGWAATSATVAKTATGIDGVANTASTVTATAGNATVLFAITNASTARAGSIFLKRRTGTGNIDITLDGGSTWTTQAITSSWARYSITQTLANPSIGVRVVTNGDAVDVDGVQCEDGAFVTSPILTYGATATRAADTLAVSNTTVGFIGQFEGTVVTDIVFASATHTVARTIVSIDDGSATNRVVIRSDVNANAGDGGELLVTTSSVDQADVTYSTDFTTALTRVGAVYAANDFRLYRAGASVGTPDTSGTAPATTTLRLGNSSAGTAAMNGWITRARVAKNALTGGQMVNLTT